MGRGALLPARRHGEAVLPLRAVLQRQQRPVVGDGLFFRLVVGDEDADPRDFGVELLRHEQHAGRGAAAAHEVVYDEDAAAAAHLAGAYIHGFDVSARGRIVHAHGGTVAGAIAEAADGEGNAERVGGEHRDGDALYLGCHDDVGFGVGEQRGHAVTEREGRFWVEDKVAVVNQSAGQVPLRVCQFFSDLGEQRLAVFGSAYRDEARAAAASAVDLHLSESLRYHRRIDDFDVVADDGL